MYDVRYEALPGKNIDAIYELAIPSRNGAFLGKNVDGGGQSKFCRLFCRWRQQLRCRFCVSTKGFCFGILPPFDIYHHPALLSKRVALKHPVVDVSTPSLLPCMQQSQGYELCRHALLQEVKPVLFLFCRLFEGHRPVPFMSASFFRDYLGGTAPPRCAAWWVGPVYGRWWVACGAETKEA